MNWICNPVLDAANFGDSSALYGNTDYTGYLGKALRNNTKPISIQTPICNYGIFIYNT